MRASFRGLHLRMPLHNRVGRSPLRDRPSLLQMRCKTVPESRARHPLRNPRIPRRPPDRLIENLPMQMWPTPPARLRVPARPNCLNPPAKILKNNHFDGSQSTEILIFKRPLTIRSTRERSRHALVRTNRQLTPNLSASSRHCGDSSNS